MSHKFAKVLLQIHFKNSRPSILCNGTKMRRMHAMCLLEIDLTGA